jgi:hypothetical protein
VSPLNVLALEYPVSGDFVNAFNGHGQKTKVAVTVDHPPANRELPSAHST